MKETPAEVGRSVTEGKRKHWEPLLAVTSQGIVFSLKLLILNVNQPLKFGRGTLWWPWSSCFAVYIALVPCC